MTPNMTTKPVIKSISEEAGTDQSGAPTTNIRVQFTVGTHGPFTERFPKASFSLAQVQPVLQAFADKVNQVHAIGS